MEVPPLERRGNLKFLGLDAKSVTGSHLPSAFIILMSSKVVEGGLRHLVHKGLGATATSAPPVAMLPV